MDGRWDINDLYQFPRAYFQAYAFTYVFDTRLEPRDIDRIDYALESYPWRGGYSVVNIYTVLQNQVDREYRPEIVEIRYASPGWIDLLLHLGPAVQIAISVGTTSSSIVATKKAYDAVQAFLKHIRERNARRRIEDFQLLREEIEELNRLNSELAKLMKFNGLDKLTSQTKSEYVSAILMAAQYRRLKILEEFSSKGKAILPPNPRNDG